MYLIIHAFVVQVLGDWGVLVGAQGGQRLLDLELPGQDPQAINRRQVLSGQLLLLL